MVTNVGKPGKMPQARWQEPAVRNYRLGPRPVIWWLTWSEDWQVDMVCMIHPALSLHTYTIYHQSLTWGKLLSSVNGLTDTWIHLLESYTLGLPRSEAWKTKLKNTIVFASNIYLLEYSFRCFLLLDCFRLLHVFDISISTCSGSVRCHFACVSN